MTAPNFRERLRQELESRRSKNPRYSLRALATFLGTDHSTLSQVLRGTRPVPARRIRSWAKKLGCGREETTVYIAAEHVPDAQTAERHQQLRQWTAEALSVVSDPVHWRILRLSRAADFQADCRWIAEETDSTVDQVNLALSRLLRLGLLEMSAAGKWKDLTGLRRLTEPEFRKLALARVREKIRT
jgi:transcriptional regulator with XRE-family HTH domain